MPKNNARYNYIQQRLIYKIDGYGCLIEREPCRVRITPQHNSLKTRITPKLATAIRYPIYKYTAFLHYKLFVLPNATVL